MDDKPWTFTQFCQAMQAAGWRLRSREGSFEHTETGTMYAPFNWTAEGGEQWKELASKRETPPVEEE